jgi:hypothetical protein
VTAGPAHDARRLGARSLRPGVTTGVVASAPSAAAATGSALLAACGSCVGLGSSVAAGTAVSAGGGAAAGAATGAAGGTFPGTWQLVFAAAVFTVLALLQVRRALRVAPPGTGRTRFVLRRVAPSLAVAAVAFVAVQLLVVPWLAAPLSAAGPVLP